MKIDKTKTKIQNNLKAISRSLTRHKSKTDPVYIHKSEAGLDIIHPVNREEALVYGSLLLKASKQDSENYCIKTTVEEFNKADNIIQEINNTDIYITVSEDFSDFIIDIPDTDTKCKLAAESSPLPDWMDCNEGTSELSWSTEHVSCVTKVTLGANEVSLYVKFKDTFSAQVLSTIYSKLLSKSVSPAIPDYPFITQVKEPQVEAPIEAPTESKPEPKKEPVKKTVKSPKIEIPKEIPKETKEVETEPQKETKQKSKEVPKQEKVKPVEMQKEEKGEIKLTTTKQKEESSPQGSTEIQKVINKLVQFAQEVDDLRTENAQLKNKMKEIIKVLGA